MGIPLFHFLQAIDIILTVNLKFYLAFQCTRILLYAIKHGFKTLRSLTHGKEQQTTIIQVHPQPQPDSALLDWDIDEIAVPVLEPKRPSLMSVQPFSMSHTNIYSGKLDLESGELLDGELDELRIPILEPKRVFMPFPRTF